MVMESVLLRVSEWAIPLFLIFVPLYALLRKVDVYAAFCEGAAEGVALLLKMLPFLLAMLVAIEVFRASGAMDILLGWFAPLAEVVGLPTEILPLAMLRSLSGSGALAMTAEIIEEHGADSFLARLAATMQGSTDTTFYVLTVYFGSVGVVRYRHALVVGLLADLAAFAAAFVLCSLAWG
jgi:spore maturation protein B